MAPVAYILSSVTQRHTLMIVWKERKMRETRLLWLPEGFIQLGVFFAAYIRYCEGAKTNKLKFSRKAHRIIDVILVVCLKLDWIWIWVIWCWQSEDEIMQRVVLKRLLTVIFIEVFHCWNVFHDWNQDHWLHIATKQSQQVGVEYIGSSTSLCDLQLPIKPLSA